MKCISFKSGHVDYGLNNSVQQLNSFIANLLKYKACSKVKYKYVCVTTYVSLVMSLFSLDCIKTVIEASAMFLLVFAYSTHTAPGF